MAGHAALADQNLFVGVADWHVIDPVHRPGLDPGSKHIPGRPGRFGYNGFDPGLAEPVGLGVADDAIFGEVRQNRRSINLPGDLGDES